jgi:hypothetical protein
VSASSVSWNLAYPQTISYRTLSDDWSIKCGQSDAAFDAQVSAAGIASYEIYMTAGMRGTCGRLKAEQLKRLHPQKMVLLYENPSGSAPTTWPGGTWAGYYLLMNRTTAVAPVDSTTTQIPVADAAAFTVGDTAVMWSPTSSDPYTNSEWVSITAINASTLTVHRDFFGAGTQSYATPPLIAAAATGPAYPNPDFNLSSVAPVNPASGERANQWLAANMLSDFAASAAGAPTLDGMELDSAASKPVVQNANGALENVDCDGDGVIDYCQTDVGTSQQVDAYGVGYDQFVQLLDQGLVTYDTDPTRPSKMLLADGEVGLRSTDFLDGAEFESFPTWDDYNYSSPALDTLGVWTADAGRAGDHLSYAFTKDATPLYPQAGCGGTLDLWCSNADYRFGMAAALVLSDASGYNNEASFGYAQDWDEEATIDQATTGLAPGYLGAPLGPAVRLHRYTSGQLLTNGDFESDLTGVTSTGVTAAALTITRDTTTAANGSASMRVDVNGVSADPGLCESRAMLSITGPTAPGEYTIDFWAKAQNGGAGPAALNMGVGLAGIVGPADRVLVPPIWTHYYLQISQTTPTTKSYVKFCVGEGVGHYWIDGVRVHRGTAGILTREFTNGIVVLNDSFATQTNIPLPDGPYHHINGVQDRTVNDGSSVASLLPSIAAKDGMILLRG